MNKAYLLRKKLMLPFEDQLMFENCSLVNTSQFCKESHDFLVFYTSTVFLFI